MTTQEVLNLQKGTKLNLLPASIYASQGLVQFTVKSVKTMKDGTVKIYPQEKFCVSVTESAFARLQLA